MDFNGNDKQHQMMIAKTYPNGAQEWYCPTCGRRFIMQWPPNYSRVILEEGDSEAVHSGGTGGVVMGSVEVQPIDSQEAAQEDRPMNSGSLDDLDCCPEDFVDEDDPYLSPWARWINDKGV